MINLMTYDFHGGSFESKTGHNSPLKAHPMETGSDAYTNVVRPSFFSITLQYSSFKPIKRRWERMKDLILKKNLSKYQFGNLIIFDKVIKYGNNLFSGMDCKLLASEGGTCSQNKCRHGIVWSILHPRQYQQQWAVCPRPRRGGPEGGLHNGIRVSFLLRGDVYNISIVKRYIFLQIWMWYLVIKIGFLSPA